jgi:mono/diheme cytochrome c family protein
LEDRKASNALKRILDLGLDMRLYFILLMIVGLLLVNGCGDISSKESLADRYLNDQAAIQRGRLLFAGTCAGYCHKLTPERSDAPYLFDCEWIHGGDDKEIYTSISNGIAGTRMIAFGENFPEGADDLWKIISYLKVNRRTCG